VVGGGDLCTDNCGWSELFRTVEEKYNPKISIPTCAPFDECGYIDTNFTFIIKVENKGTKEDTIGLTAHPDNPTGLDISLSNNSVTLSPSESKFIYLNVLTKSEIFINLITINATSEGDNSKVSSCKVSTGTLSNPLYFSFHFDNTDTKNHTLNFNAPAYIKLSNQSLTLKSGEMKLLGIVFDPDFSQTGIRDFYVEITDATSGETVKIPIKLNPDYEIIATDFDVFDDGYNFSNWPIIGDSLLNKEIGGHCFSMSETSILYQKNILPLPNDAENTYNIPEPIAKPTIDIFLWAHLSSNLASGVSVKNPFLNETEEYKKLKNCIAWGTNPRILSHDPVILTMWDGSIFGGIHAVVAYRIVEIGDKAYVSIYDNNYPYTATNFNNAFSCAIFNTTSGEFKYLNTYTKSVVVIPSLLSIQSTTLVVECPVNATITDQYGRIIADNGTNEILDADMIIMNETKIFYLPANLTYSVDIGAYDTGTFNFTRVSPIGSDISITKFENISITASTKAFVEIKPDVTNYTMSIDYDGDGVYETNIAPDVNETIVITPTTTITRQITTSPDDGYSSPAGYYNSTANLTMVGTFGEVDFNGWYRFRNVTIPEGANITRAFVALTAYSDIYTTVPDDTLKTVIRAEYAANPLPPSSASDHAGRFRTPHSVEWNITEWEAGEIYSSPDISDIIQSLVNVHDYSSGAAIQIFHDVTDDVPDVLYQPEAASGEGSITACTYDHSPLDAARLYIEYTVTSLRGDLNHDGCLTPADAAIALRIAASGAHDDAAEVSGDGCVTSLDALMILQAAARAITL
jgi:hypothetical protein